VNLFSYLNSPAGGPQLAGGLVFLNLDFRQFGRLFALRQPPSSPIDLVFDSPPDLCSSRRFLNPVDGVSLMRVECCKAIAICVAMGLYVSEASGASITRLPDWFGAPTVRRLFMLPDGQTFIGVDGTDVFRWSKTPGRTNLGSIAEGDYYNPVRISAVSDDGSTIIGYVGETPHTGFVWNQPNGTVYIPDSADGDLQQLIPTAVSADGKIILGRAFEPELPFDRKLVAFRWTQDVGVESLGFSGSIGGISADGTTMVGSKPVTEFTNEAFRWTEASGAVSIGQLPSELPSSFAQFVSHDGSIIVGGSFGANPTTGPITGPKAVRWTEQDGLQQLTDRGNDQWVNDISADANVIVGSIRTLIVDAVGFAITHEAFLWTSKKGLRTLPELITELGLDLPDPTHSEPASYFASLVMVSDDGNRILLQTTEFTYDNGPYVPSIHQEYWLLDISAVPEPSTSGLCCIAFATVMSLCRRRSSVSN
jgi:uncharacterized membrane protein